MRGDTRCAVFGHMGQKQLALPRIRTCQALTIVAQPFHIGQAMQRLTIGLPACRVTPAKTVQQLLRLAQRQVVGAHLYVQQHQVHVQEKIEVHMRDVQHNGRFALAQGHAPLVNVVAPEHPHRRVRPGFTSAARGPALAVQKTLHIRQKGHELAVVALVELVGTAGVFVHHLAPG